MGWAESGQAWGERATGLGVSDGAVCAERQRRAVLTGLGVGQGTRLLDIACGSGYAASVAAGRGASVAGLDASEALIAIARARTPARRFPGR